MTTGGTAAGTGGGTDPGTDPGEVLRLSLHDERDVFVARQRGREVAAAAGLENQDQVRVATALSELGRELVLRGRRPEVGLALVGSPAPALRLTLGWDGEVPGIGGTEGVRAATRLVDGCEVVQGGGRGSIVLIKRLSTAVAPGPALVHGLRDRFRRSATRSALDELRAQNQELLRTLESLQAERENLVRVNAELEETNRGVLALHAELSGELDETNRGVVALYAELDERSTQLREASESKTRFWANVSHELRTPINSVIGLARLLLDPGSEPLTAEQHQQASMIRDSGSVLLALVNELLDVAKAESGRLEPRPEPVDLTATLQHLSAALAPLVPAGVRLVVTPPAEPLALLTDPSMLLGVLRNLATNALRFTERGEVRISADVDHAAGLLSVTVRDTGIGIPAEHLARVFEEFHQVPGPLQVRGHGTGLGLPYARRLAGILDGSLALDSEPGRGTTATLLLPLSGPAPTGGQLGDVLVVDDDPAFRALVRRMLGASGRVREAADGPSALAALRAGAPDLLVLDLHIPPPDGRAVLRALREDPRTAGLPVLVVTAAEPDPAARRELGATAVVLQKTNLTPALLVASAASATRLAEAPRG